MVTVYIKELEKKESILGTLSKNGLNNLGTPSKMNKNIFGIPAKNMLRNNFGTNSKKNISDGDGSHFHFLKKNEKTQRGSFIRWWSTYFWMVSKKYLCSFWRVSPNCSNYPEQSRKIYIISNPNKTSVYKRVLKKLEKEKTKTEKVQVVLSNKLKKYEQYFKGCKILDGKPILLNSIEPILEKILGQNSFALQDIYILTDYYQEKNINLIRTLASKVKTINVITKEIEKYKIIEEMLQEQGISIVVSNNKRKSLKNAKIIINLDFDAEKLNQYIIFRNAVIINLTQEKLTNLKGFDGIIVRDIKLKLKKEDEDFIKQNELEDFRQLEIYESLQNKLSLSNKLEIDKMYGNNGQIEEKELDNLRMNFCEFSVKN